LLTLNQLIRTFDSDSKTEVSTLKSGFNDIFYFVKKGTLYNYADDNTLSYGHPDFNVLTSVLESESNVH
jgi:hypothetical protein